MSQELCYTSVPKGLDPSKHGFCTVAHTQGMSPRVVEALERLSAYSMPSRPNDPSALTTPVLYGYYRIRVMDKGLNVLSRICFAGADYSGRSNKFAHHVVLGPDELADGGPAWLIGHPGLMHTTFAGTPGIVPQGPTIPRGDYAASFARNGCRAWQKATHDAGWAGVLAEGVLADPIRPALIVYEPGTDVLPLIAEALWLVPKARRWDITFNTYLTSMPQGSTCHWRCCLPDSKAVAEARRIPGITVINLLEKLPQAPDGPLVTQARTGVPADPADLAKLGSRGGAPRKREEPTPEQLGTRRPGPKRPRHAREEPDEAEPEVAQAPEAALPPRPPTRTRTPIVLLLCATVLPVLLFFAGLGVGWVLGRRHGAPPRPPKPGDRVAQAPHAKPPSPDRRERPDARPSPDRRPDRSAKQKRDEPTERPKAPTPRTKAQRDKGKSPAPAPTPAKKAKSAVAVTKTPASPHKKAKKKAVPAKKKAPHQQRPAKPAPTPAKAKRVYVNRTLRDAGASAERTFVADLQTPLDVGSLKLHDPNGAEVSEIRSGISGLSCSNPSEGQLRLSLPGENASSQGKSLLSVKVVGKMLKGTVGGAFDTLDAEVITIVSAHHIVVKNKAGHVVARVLLMPKPEPLDVPSLSKKGKTTVEPKDFSYPATLDLTMAAATPAGFVSAFNPSGAPSTKVRTDTLTIRRRAKGGPKPPEGQKPVYIKVIRRRPAAGGQFVEVETNVGPLLAQIKAGESSKGRTATDVARLERTVAGKQKQLDQVDAKLARLRGNKSEKEADLQGLGAKIKGALDRARQFDVTGQKDKAKGQRAIAEDTRKNIPHAKQAIREIKGYISGAETERKKVERQLKTTKANLAKAKEKPSGGIGDGEWGKQLLKDLGPLLTEGITVTFRDRAGFEVVVLRLK